MSKSTKNALTRSDDYSDDMSTSLLEPVRPNGWTMIDCAK